MKDLSVFGWFNCSDDDVGQGGGQMAEGIRHAALCALLSYLSVMYSLPRAELRRFLQARPENADRSNECAHAGALDLSRVAAEARVAVVVGDCRFPTAEQATPRAREHLAFISRASEILGEL